MDQSELSREDCSEFAAVLVNDEEFAPIVANCTEHYAGNLEAFGVCMKDVMAEIDLRLENTKFHGAFLYAYCAGITRANSTMNEWESALSEMPDTECKEWAYTLDAMHPAQLSRSLCWDTDSVVNLMFDYSDQVSVRWQNVVDCMSSNLGNEFPDMPACRASYPNRANCS